MTIGIHYRDYPESVANLLMLVDVTVEQRRGLSVILGDRRGCQNWPHPYVT